MVVSCEQTFPYFIEDKVTGTGVQGRVHLSNYGATTAAKMTFKFLASIERSPDFYVLIKGRAWLNGVYFGRCKISIPLTSSAIIE
jgi:hypothetical protein